MDPMRKLVELLVGKREGWHAAGRAIADEILDLRFGAGAQGTVLYQAGCPIAARSAFPVTTGAELLKTSRLRARQAAKQKQGRREHDIAAGAVRVPQNLPKCIKAQRVRLRATTQQRNSAAVLGWRALTPCPFCAVPQNRNLPTKDETHRTQDEGGSPRRNLRLRISFR